MKEQMNHQSSKVDVERQDQATQTKKPVNCHLKLSPEADGKLLKIQRLLRTENIKVSKTGIINLLLENLNVEYFGKDLSVIFGNKFHNDIVQLFLNSEMNEDDLKILKMMKNENKVKSES